MRYDVRLLISHPSMAPEEISRELNVTPDVQHKAGDQIVTPKGSELGGKYFDTRWSIGEEVEDLRAYFTSVTEFLDWLQPKRAFLHRLRTGGGAAIITFSLPGQENIGSVITWEDLARFADLRLDLGVEVFPDF